MTKTQWLAALRTHTVQTNRGEGQCSLLEEFGEKKYLEFVFEKQMKRLNQKEIPTVLLSLVITPKTQICYKPSHCLGAV